MERVDTAAIVGLGLIGGSIARDLAERGVRVVAADRDRATLDAAIREGIVAAALGPELDGVEQAAALLIAVPVTSVPDVLAALDRRGARLRLVMDVGSTKRTVVAAAARTAVGDRFVGAHPFTGDHRSGWGASRSGLFAGARVFLTTTPATTGDALALAGAMWSALGAQPELVDAVDHDRLVARTSHLPQAAASALGLLLGAGGVSRRELGRGAAEMTRLAGSSPEVWGAICADNAEPLGEALAEYQRHLDRLADALDRRDQTALEQWFAEAQRWFDEESR